MLNELHLIDFKSFADQRIRLSNTTLLVGANASGKSNFLDALRFLQGVGMGLPVADVLRGRWEAEREVWPGIRGGVAEVARAEHSSFAVESAWAIERRRFEHKIRVTLAPEPLVDAESLTLDGDVLFDSHAPSLGSGCGRSGATLRVAFCRRGPGRRPSSDLSAGRSVIGQVHPVEGMDERVLDGIQRVGAALRSLVFLDIRPAVMRSYVPAQMTALGADGRNLSAVVKRLTSDGAKKRDLLDWLSEFCAPEIADLEFDETRLLQEVMLVLVEKSGAKVSARSISDGTLRFLGELVALLTAPDGAVLLMEEIENGLHPARVHLLIELVETVTRPGRCQVIATTHSPLALAALSQSALGGAVVFGRHSEAEGSMMRRLKELPNFDEIVSRRGIEHLFTTKWLERAL